MDNLYSYITAAAPTTTIVCPKPCILDKITFNKALATGVVTVYDGETVANGTVVAVITSPATLLHNQFTLHYGMHLKRGCTIVTSTAAQDITVTYRVA